MNRKVWKKRGRKRGGYTDDSGNVISLKEYIDLHCERPVHHQAIPGIKLYEEPDRNIFAEIAHMEEKPSPRLVNLVRCEYCGVKVRRDNIGGHTIKVHHTSDLRFKSLEKSKSHKQRRKAQSYISPAGQSRFPEDREKSDEMAHYRREGNGQFGSYPLHDDYGDEADA